MAGNVGGAGGGAAKKPIMITLVVLVVAVIILLALVFYEFGELSSLQNSYNNLQADDSDLSAEVAGLDNQLFALQNQLNSLTTTTASHAPGLSVNITSACISITPSCNGTLAYAITLYNTGGVTISANYSIFVEFKGGTKNGILGFNTTMPNSPFVPGEYTSVVANSWPTYLNGASVAQNGFDPGDTIGLSVGVGSFLSTAIPVKIQNTSAG